MKILHLLSQRPEMTGSGIYINQMIKKSAAQGFKNGLLAGMPAKHQWSRADSIDRFFPVYFGEGGDIPFPVVGMSDVMPYSSTRFRDMSADLVALYERSLLEKLEYAIESFQPDIIHSNHLWLMTALVKKWFPAVPVVASCHGSDLRQFRVNPHLQERVISGCAQLEGVLALSPAQAREISELYDICPSRIHVAGVGYDASIFRPKNKITENRFSILYAGKLANAKGVPWLLEAFRSLSGKEVTLHLCGSGSGAEAEKIIADAMLDPRVIVHGNVDQKTLAGLMAGADIFVLPSFFEGVPLVLLEAMACGCRLVATRLPGVEYILPEPSNCATLVNLPELESVDQPVKDAGHAFAADLAQAIQQQLYRCQQPVSDKECPQASKTLANFTWDAVFDRVLTAYRIAHGNSGTVKI
ncbi:glycosyltransferase family 4 protein [Endozoicomonas sp. Mp262]|uniref:glycosyltransferase family 4 protein n=1 Tax=Endozoicomonas sp. Mp262 TaxID=2919499 RepID=UPI0021DAD64F